MFETAKHTSALTHLVDYDYGSIYYNERGFWRAMDDHWAYGPWPSFIAAKTSALDEFLCFVLNEAWSEGNYCDDCGQRDPKMTLQDFGIGSYEFWGSYGHHHDWRWVTTCCGSDQVDQAGNLVEVEEREREYEHD